MVDEGYPNRLGYLAQYKGQRYHVPDWRRGTAPSGEQETFNYLHSSIRNVVERIPENLAHVKWVGMRPALFGPARARTSTVGNRPELA
jgi:hypothetical protein